MGQSGGEAVGAGNPVAKRDYYEVRGVARDAGDAEIKAAYRMLGGKFYPDHNPDGPGAEHKFEEAVFGLPTEIQVPRMEACGRCSGSGSEPGSGPSTCPTCNGRGEVLYQQSFLSIRRTCSTCNGSGQLIRNPCQECRGHGSRQ